MRLRSTVLAATLVVGAVAAVAPTPVVGPVCHDPIPRDVCGGRVFAEPLQSASAVTYRGAVAGLETLAAEHPDRIRLTTIGESADGLDLLAVEVTAAEDDPTALPLAQRRVVLVNQSIHGNEPGGREGGLRYVEDLVTGRDPEREALLGQVRLVQTFINPDGWAAGDHDHVQTGGGAGLWVRQNGTGALSGAGDLGLGIDLNRQAPWPGPSRRGPAPVEAPEAAAYVTFVRDLAATSDIVAAVDIHGEVTDAAALVMLSAGEYDLDEAMSARAQGDAMVDRLFDTLDDSQAAMLTQALGEYPAGKLIASSEFAGGGTDTGYMGDWVSMATGGDAASLSTIELYNFLASPGVNSLTARKEVMQLYRDVVREIMASMIEEAAVTHDTELVVDGRVGWVDLHERVDDPVTGEVRTSAAFWEDLSAQVDGGLARLTVDDLTASTLADHDVLVLSRDTLGLGPLSAVFDWVDAGGRLVLTDSGVALVDELLDGRLDAQVRIDGDARIGIGDGPLTEGVREDAFMLVEPVTVGYNRSLAGRTDNVPTWTVDAAIWDSLGGSAELTAAGRVAGGSLVVGDGSVHLIGLLTPPVVVPTEDPVDHGLEDHGVLDSGYLVLTNALGGELVRTTTPVATDRG